MPRLVNIVGLYKAEFAQGADYIVAHHVFIDSQPQGRFLDTSAALHLLGKRLGIGNHNAGAIVLGPVVEHLGAEDSRRGIHLPVFYVALVTRGENEHIAFSKDLAEVEIDVSGIVVIVGNNNHFSLVGKRNRSESNRHRRAGKPTQRHIADFVVGNARQCCNAAFRVDFLTKRLYVHCNVLFL